MEIISHKLRIGILLGLFGMVCLFRSGFAETHYVATNGDDNNRGTFTDPWKTVIFAVENTAQGDTILVREGTYKEGVIIFRGSRSQFRSRDRRQDRSQGGRVRGEKGEPYRTRPDARRGRDSRNEIAYTPDSYWVLKAYPGEEVVIESAGHLRIRVPYVRIEGIHFRGSGVGTLGSHSRGGAHHIQFIGNRFTGEGFRYSAISVGGDSNLVEGNIIEIEGQGGTLDHGIYVHSGKNNIIRNNYISGSEGYGIHLFYQSRGSGSRSPGIISGTLIENNVITNSKQRSGIIVATAKGQMLLENLIIRNNIIFGNRGNGIDLKSNIKDIEIYNNTIYGNEMGGITMGLMSKMGGSVENVTIKNNIIHNNTGDINHIQSNSESVKGHAVEHNLFWPAPFRSKDISNASNNIVADPKFNDPENYDFSLSSGSPAKDEGENLQISFSGKAPDLGALETGNDNKAEIVINMFHANSIGKVVKLSWHTFLERTRIGFEIERTEAKQKAEFEKIGFISGKGPSVIVHGYEFLDENVMPGTYLYRLKKITKGGDFTTSPSIKVKVRGSQSSNLDKSAQSGGL